MSRGFSKAEIRDMARKLELSDENLRPVCEDARSILSCAARISVAARYLPRDNSIHLSRLASVLCALAGEVGDQAGWMMEERERINSTGDVASGRWDAYQRHRSGSMRDLLRNALLPLLEVVADMDGGDEASDRAHSGRLVIVRARDYPGNAFRHALEDTKDYLLALEKIQERRWEGAP